MEPKKTKKKTEKLRNHARDIAERLVKEYTGEYRCYLNHENAWQLLFATILSAQCTDARVNIVTAELFRKYPDIEAFAEATLEELEEDIRPTGFYHNKAKNIIGCARMLLEKHHGEVPDTIEELVALPGVGRKTANVIRGNIYHHPSIVVDTHVKRISKKLGLTKQEDPEKIEFELMEVLPEEYWILYNIHIIQLGRTICTARSPKCGECFLREVCPSCSAKGEADAVHGN